MNYQAPVKTTLLELRNLRTQFQTARGTVKAVDGVSFELHRGEVLSLVGESGSGKSTIGRAILNLDAPTAGEVKFDGRAITGLTRREMRPLRHAMQMVFQDPYSSLNPKHTVEQLLSAPLEIHAPEVDEATPVRDLAHFRDTALLPTMTVKDAMVAFERAEAEALAVIDSLEKAEVVGLLTEAYTLRRYKDELEQRRQELLGE